MQTHYERIGGKAVVRGLMDRFYDLMDSEPEYYGIRKLHSQDLSGSRQKLFMFLSGWMGGPPLYETAYGHPMLRVRHRGALTERTEAGIQQNRGSYAEQEWLMASC